MRVVCGLRDVIAIFCPIRRFISVDFPTLGRPISVTKPDLKLFSIFLHHSLYFRFFVTIQPCGRRDKGSAQVYLLAKIECLAVYAAKSCQSSANARCMAELLHFLFLSALVIGITGRPSKVFDCSEEAAVFINLRFTAHHTHIILRYKAFHKSGKASDRLLIG